MLHWSHKGRGPMPRITIYTSQASSCQQIIATDFAYPSAAAQVGAVRPESPLSSQCTFVNILIMQGFKMRFKRWLSMSLFCLFVLQGAPEEEGPDGPAIKADSNLINCCETKGWEASAPLPTQSKSQCKHIRLVPVLAVSRYLPLRNFQLEILVVHEKLVLYH